MSHKWSIDENGNFVKTWDDGVVQIVDPTQLPDVSADFLIHYGAKQWLSDHHGAQGLTMAQKQEMTQARIDRLMNGTPHVRISSSLPAAVYAEALVDLELTSESLESATGSIQLLIDAPDDKEAVKRLNKIKRNDLVKQWLVDNGHRAAPKREQLL